MDLAEVAGAADRDGETEGGEPPSFAAETAANRNNATDHTANILQPSIGAGGAGIYSDSPWA
jgi:hypothetical protein